MLNQRYERNLPLISVKQQRALAGVIVAIVGLGGLGGYVAELCARIGIGSLIIIDGDVFTGSNLNRQRFSTEYNLDKSKAEETKRALHEINSETKITAHTVYLKDDTDIIYVQDADIVIDCLDNITGRFLIEKFCISLKIPLIHGSLSDWDCQYGFFFSERSLMKKIYSHGTATKFEQKANLPGVPPIVAAMQVNLLTLYLTESEKLKVNNLYRFNILSQELVSLDLN